MTGSVLSCVYLTYYACVLSFRFLMFCVSQFVFFFQAEDGIRDVAVTGVQTCALPICFGWQEFGGGKVQTQTTAIDIPTWQYPYQAATFQIGRASCRERV